MSTLNSRLQLAILNRKKSKNLSEKGFTLIELLITVVILGTLSAIALPNFLGVRDSANAKSAIASATALAKDCSTSIVAETTAPTQTDLKGVVINSTACGAGQRTYTAGNLDPEEGDYCLNSAATGGNNTCTIRVSAAGVVDGLWSTVS